MSKTMKTPLPQLLLKKIPWPIYVALGLFALGGLAFGAWQTLQPGQTGVEQTSAQAAAVRQGDNIQTISGTGILIAGKSADLNFPVDGEVDELRVQVGDEVKTGQMLAVLDNLEELEVNIQNQQLAVEAAQKTLDELMNGDVQLARALANLAKAQSAYEEAVKNHRQPGEARCSLTQTQEYYFQYLYAQQRVTEWEDYLESGNTGYGTDFILTQLAPLQKERDRAYTNWKYCESHTEQEILESDAALQVAQANLRKAEEDYQCLLDNSGVNPEEVEIARAALKNSEMQLIKAQNDLAGATLTAPMDGTIISIGAGAGEAVKAGAVYITIADLKNPLVQVSIDEADLQKFAVGCSAQITFDAIKERVFKGVITQVSPTLVTFPFGEMSVVQGLVELQEAALMPGETLRLNLDGAVAITCNQASAN